MNNDRHSIVALQLRTPITALLTAWLCTLAGCGYALPGKVVEGFGSVTVGVPTDSEAQQLGVAGVVVELIRDPDTMNRARVAQATSGPDGSFTLVVDSFGAGWMEEKWQLRVRRSGYLNVESEVDLPSSTNGRMLIISIARGRSQPFHEPTSSRGLLDEAKQYEPGVGSTIR